MSSTTSIDLHEFSTGIQAETTADGGWVSQGFTGQYMNKTIDPIPRAVQEAITNRDFAVAEGASSDEPAFIGREVAGYGEEWSVVAVVTRGRDDRGRSASVYRYFLSEGLGNLGKILSWINAQKQAGQNIIFAPFDTQTLGQPHQYSEFEPDLALRPELESLLESSPPIIIPSDSPCAPLIVNKMALAIADGQLIAWGYNVEALEEPRGFQVIQPASSRAEDLLQKAIASKPNAPAPVSGEKNIISAINGLVKRDRVKPEQIEVIENALANPQINSSYWESLFKGRGTDKALKQGIYSADMVRLLTLKAILLPETLPEFLLWINKEGKQQESKEVSENFQTEIKKSLDQVSESATNLKTKIYQGVISIIPRLKKQPKLLDSVVWLLSSDKGLWGYFYSSQVKKKIDNDLALMSSYGRGKQNLDFKLTEDKEWQKIFNEIQVYWRHRSGNQPQYQPLAELFSQLNNYQLSALFYHVSSGVVPKEVFYKLASRGFRTQVYGITVKRYIDFYEYLWITTVTLGGVELKAIVVFGLILSGLILGGGLRNFVLKSDTEKTIDKIAEDFTKEYTDMGFKPVKKKQVKTNLLSIIGESTNIDWKCNIANKLPSSPPINASELMKQLNCNANQRPINATIILAALKEFDKSQSNFNEIIEDLKKAESSKDQPELETQAVKKIKEVLGDQSLQSCIIIKKCQKNQEIQCQEEWIKKIYLYQQISNLDSNGILDGKTLNQFKQKVLSESQQP